MRELNSHQKIKVIQLFIRGYSFEEIARQVGVAKGSVVNIVSDFREGEIQLPAGDSEYIDFLRQVAVDLRKSNANIKEVKQCLRLYSKLAELSATTQQAEEWVDTCQDLASSTASSIQLIKSARELSQASSESGLSYQEAVSEYTDKVQSLKQIEKETECKRAELEETEQQHAKQKESAIRELKTIKGTIASVQESFSKQKQELEAQFADYLEQNRLKWDNLKLVESVVNSGFDVNSLTNDEITRLRNAIIKIGSLFKVLKQLTKQKSVLETDIGKLAKQVTSYNNSLHEIKASSQQFIDSLVKMRHEKSILDKEIPAKKQDLEQLDNVISKKSENLYLNQLILNFLLSPKDVSDRDLDRLVNIMIALRQRRLGISPSKVTDKNGDVVCECQLPEMRDNFYSNEVNTDHAREVFAYLLTPLVLTCPHKGYHSLS